MMLDLPDLPSRQKQVPCSALWGSSARAMSKTNMVPGGKALLKATVQACGR